MHFAVLVPVTFRLNAAEDTPRREEEPAACVRRRRARRALSSAPRFFHGGIMYSIRTHARFFARTHRPPQAGALQYHSVERFLAGAGTKPRSPLPYVCYVPPPFCLSPPFSPRRPPEQLSLFGLANTRKAAAAFRVSSATASEEWDALPARKTAVARVVDQEGSVWTAPETWLAAAAKQAAAAEKAAVVSSEEAGDESPPSPPLAEREAAAASEAGGAPSATVAEVAGITEALENKKQAAFAADAYAFGMVSWEVRVQRLEPCVSLLPALWLVVVVVVVS